MNNIEKMATEASNVQKFAKKYFSYLSILFNEIDTSAIEAFIKRMEKNRRQGNTIFFIGNGGSAATASHMANDFGIGLRSKENEKPFCVLSLTDNVSAMTAIANDYGYDKLFIYQLKVLYQKGDTLVAISASGNSPNVVNAAEWVKKQGGKVIGLVGFDGGKLKKLSDIVIHIKTPKGEYGPVEDIHMILDHLIYSWFKSQGERN